MKKVLVAAAGLMLVGTMASTAMAEFYFSGDARARFFLQNDYDEIAGFASDEDTRFNNRVRLNIKADTKGGAYWVGRLRAGGVNGTWGTANNNNDPDFDRNYVGVPFGAVTMEAGRQGRDVTPWFLYGLTNDGVDFNYKTDTTTLVGFYDMLDENLGNVDDDDAAATGLVLVQQFEGGWALTGGLVYYYDDINDDDDFGATINLAGALGAAAVTAEISYAGEEFATNTGEDDGWGGYISATLPLGAVDLTGMAGFTMDGFTYDGDDFGPFEMLGGVNWVNTGFNPSEYGETILVAFNPVFKATEKLTLGAVLAWANADGYAAGSEEYDMFEISGRATYAVTDGASLIGVLGYLDTDDATDDNPFGAGIGVQLKF